MEGSVDLMLTLMLFFSGMSISVHPADVVASTKVALLCFFSSWWFAIYNKQITLTLSNILI